MKKIYMTLFLLVLTSAVFAGTTGSIVLTGTVNGVMDISVIPEPVASNLDLSSSQTDLPIALIIEKSNKASGYRVELESANALALGTSSGVLVGSTDSLTYTLKYNGQEVILINGKALITDSILTTGANGVSKVLAISYTADTGMVEGTYSDTITVTISAK